jgi:hypothetical protein
MLRVEGGHLMFLVLLHCWAFWVLSASDGVKSRGIVYEITNMDIIVHILLFE